MMSHHSCVAKDFTIEKVSPNLVTVPYMIFQRILYNMHTYKKYMYVERITFIDWLIICIYLYINYCCPYHCSCWITNLLIHCFAYENVKSFPFNNYITDSKSIVVLLRMYFAIICLVVSRNIHYSITNCKNASSVR